MSKKGKLAEMIYIMLASVITLMLAVVSVYALVFVILMTLPGFIAFVIDKDRNFYFSKTVISFNIMGIAPYLMPMLLNKERANDIAINLIIDPFVWFVIYAICAVGWIVCFIVPSLFVAINRVRVEWIKTKLHKNLDELKDEWGQDVASSFYGDKSSSDEENY
jgi:hypothetical protein